VRGASLEPRRRWSLSCVGGGVSVVSGSGVPGDACQVANLQEVHVDVDDFIVEPGPVLQALELPRRDLVTGAPSGCVIAG